MLLRGNSCASPSVVTSMIKWWIFCYDIMKNKVTFRFNTGHYHLCTNNTYTKLLTLGILFILTAWYHLHVFHEICAQFCFVICYWGNFSCMCTSCNRVESHSIIAVSSFWEVTHNGNSTPQTWGKDIRYFCESIGWSVFFHCWCGGVYNIILMDYVIYRVSFYVHLTER